MITMKTKTKTKTITKSCSSPEFSVTQFKITEGLLILPQSSSSGERFRYVEDSVLSVGSEVRGSGRENEDEVSVVPRSHKVVVNPLSARQNVHIMDSGLRRRGVNDEGLRGMKPGQRVLGCHRLYGGTITKET